MLNLNVRIVSKIVSTHFYSVKFSEYFNFMFYFHSQGTGSI